MNPAKLAERIKTLAPGTQVEVVDLTGTQDHYQALVISTAFAGKMMIDQHKMVLDLFQSEIKSNEVHALTLKTFTPEQYVKFGKKRSLT